MALFSLIAKLGIDTAQYQAGLKKAESAAEAAGRVMRNRLAQAFTVASITMFANQVAKLAGSAKDFADKFKTTREEAQLIARAAKDSGVSAEQIGETISRMDAARAKAASGNKETLQSFTTLGIELGRVMDESVSSLDLMRDAITAVSNAQDPIVAKGAAMKLMGDSSGKLAEAIASIHNLGPMIILSDEEIEKLDAAYKTVTHMKDDLITLASKGVSGVIDDYNRRLGMLGGSAPAKFIAGVDAGIMGILKFFTAGFRSDGNSDEGRLDVDAALARRAARNKGGKPPPAEVDAAATTAAAAMSRMGSATADPLAKIGGLFFGADAGMRQVPRQQLDELKKLNARVERIEQAATAN